MSDERYVCSACAEEGNPDPQPIQNFYTWIDRRYKEPRRSIVCRRHTDEINIARQRRQLDPTSPDYNQTYHENVKKWKRDYAARKLNPSSPDYDEALHARQKAAKLASKKKNRG